MNHLISLIMAVVTAVSGQLILKAAMIKIGKLTFAKPSIISELTKIFTEPFIFIGLVLYGLSFIFWLKVISTEELSRVYPLVVSSIITLILLGSAFFFKESISLIRVIGILVIIFGIYLVFRS